MSLILNIDTALETASVCIAKDGKAVQSAGNDNQKDHAAWLHTAVSDIIKKSGYRISQLEAVAVSIGPGSYTGLRVGLAAAKGLCYALHIPLLAINTLEMIALSVKEEAADLICPLVDARRMEVYVAVYDVELREKYSPVAMVIEANSFASFLATHKILFCGSGHRKVQAMISSPNALYSNTISNAEHLAQLSQHYFQLKEFADLAYTEPLYIKEFNAGPRKDGT